MAPFTLYALLPISLTSTSPRTDKAAEMEARTSGSPTSPVDRPLVQSPEVLTNTKALAGDESNSYFTAPNAPPNPESSAQAMAAVRSSAELVKDLDPVNSDLPSTLMADPHLAYPSLNLSGNVISAAFCIPYTLKFHEGGSWVRHHVHMHISV